MIESRKEPTAGELVAFGWLSFFVFTAAGAVFWYFDAIAVAVTTWAFVVVMTTAYTSLPNVRRPVFQAWMVLVRPIGFVISHVVLGSIYYGIITPIGLVMRLFGRDPMQRRSRGDTSTYWVAVPESEPADYFKQF